MLLDRALGDEDLVGDPGVGPALGHEAEHLAFAHREDLQRVVDPADGEQLLYQRGVDHGGTLHDAVERPEEVVDVADAALEEVPAALAAGQQFGGLLELDVGGQHQDCGVRQLLADHPGGVQAFGGVGGRHPDVHDDQVRPPVPDQRQQLGRVPGPPDDFEAGSCQEAGQTFPQQNVVVGHHHLSARRHHSDHYGSSLVSCPVRTATDRWWLAGMADRSWSPTLCRWVCAA